jgi:hypothetical protein
MLGQMVNIFERMTEWNLEGCVVQNTISETWKLIFCAIKAKAIYELHHRAQ